MWISSCRGIGLRSRSYRSPRGDSLWGHQSAGVIRTRLADFWTISLQYVPNPQFLAICLTLPIFLVSERRIMAMTIAMGISKAIDDVSVIRRKQFLLRVFTTCSQWQHGNRRHLRQGTSSDQRTPPGSGQVSNMFPIATATIPITTTSMTQRYPESQEVFFLRGRKRNCQRCGTVVCSTSQTLLSILFQAGMNWSHASPFRESPR